MCAGAQKVHRRPFIYNNKRGEEKKTSCDAGGRVTAVENDRKRCESDNVIEMTMSTSIVDAANSMVSDVGP